MTRFKTVKRRDAPPLTKLKVLEFLPSNISESGLKIFFTSNWFGSFLSIRDKQTKAFLRTRGDDLLDNARSKIESVKLLRAAGMMVANIDKAKDWAA